MQNLEEIYRDNFFARRTALDWRPSIICNALYSVFKMGHQASIVDVGCATGDIVKELNSRGFMADGIEGAKTALPYMQTNSVYIFDLRKQLSLEFKKYDLAISIEVAEHIEKEYSEIYVENLCKLSDLVFITAALPESKGHYHVNCQNPEYWIELFAKFGYDFNEELTQKMKKFFEPMRRKKGLSQFYINSLIFKRNAYEI